MKRLVATQTCYCWELEDAEYLKIEENDDNQTLYADTLVAKLESLEGVSRVEYNGHFGANVFFTLDKEHDTRNNLGAITDLIREYACTTVEPTV